MKKKYFEFEELELKIKNYQIDVEVIKLSLNEDIYKKKKFNLILYFVNELNYALCVLKFEIFLFWIPLLYMYTFIFFNCVNTGRMDLPIVNLIHKVL